MNFFHWLISLHQMTLKSSIFVSFYLDFKNKFCFRQLIGKPIDCTHNDNQGDIIWQSLRSLHDMGPSHIIISSISAAKTGGNQSLLQMRASTKLAG